LAIRVEVEFRAGEASKAVKRGDLIVVIDVLRSGTSILNALANGAEFLVPAISLREARGLRNQNREYLLAGERGGCKPKGFDFGNSPFEFTSERVGGKRLVMTTTSGTVALVKSRRAKWVLIGTFLNAGSVAKQAEELARKEETGVSFVLAGDKGRFSLEDFLCAGAIAAKLKRDNVCFSDGVQAAFLSYGKTEHDLCGTIAYTEHARQLAKLGLEQDTSFCCQLDTSSAVPKYRHGRITLQ
jgi:2-phosphosulfolactate phosphatase